MSLIRNSNVLWYHPLNDTTEYTQNHVWDDVVTNTSFVDGIVSEALTRSSTSTGVDLEEALIDGGYTDIDGAYRFTICFWASGFYNSSAYYNTVYIGFEDAAIVKNTIRLQKTNTDTLTFQLRIRNFIVGTKTISSKPTDSNWNFVILDAVKEGTDWRFRISFNGENWQNLGTETYDAQPNTNLRAVINLFDTSTGKFRIDEIVVWKDANLFTNTELYNLYELANTYSLPMDQYTNTFGIPVSSGIDCFIHGSTQITSSVPLYISSQTVNQSAPLLVHGMVQVSGNRSLYVEGAAVLTSGNADLFMHGSITISESTSLYITGPILSSDNADCFIHGFAIASGTSALYIKGQFPNVDAFVSVVANTPTASADLFIYGIPSGESTTFFTNNNVTLFIEDDGSNNTVNASLPSFVRVVDATTIAYSGIWSAFARVGNTANANTILYINAHASGSAPHGIQISNSGILFVAGLGSALDDGYSIATLDTGAFAKVHLGLSKSLNIYISGSIGIVQTSAESNLYIFGIQGIQSESRSLYIIGDDIANGSTNLFILGIQGISSGSAPLYIEVTDIGLFSQNITLYSHGF